MPTAPFTVAGMAGMSSSTTSHHHSPSMNTWSSPGSGPQLTSSFSDSLSQPRSHYQSGYLMSSQNNNAPQGNPRVDEAPIVPTKAKMNSFLSTSDFGMDSMFESTRQRQKLADEDAPPTNSVNDIPTEIFHTPSPRNTMLSKNVNLNQALHQQQVLPTPTFPRRQTAPPVATSSSQPTRQPIYIIVFGYPSDKYARTVEYFQELGAFTDPDPHREILNCFRIGFRNHGDALRAVRKNGEVLAGTWMIGVKLADLADADALGLAASPELSKSDMNVPIEVDLQSSSTPTRHQDDPSSNNITPLKPISASAAFKKHKQPEGNVLTPQRSQLQREWGVSQPPWSASPAHQQPRQTTQPQPVPSSGSKGVLGSVSDLIFGW